MKTTPHASLHYHLLRFRALGFPGPATDVFEDRSEAELWADSLSEREGVLHLATPVWWIDHHSLEGCSILAWTTTRHSC
jgi:hypothetical protein